MPDNNFYLLRANINNDYLENHVWSKCGRKYGFEAIDHSNKSLSYNTLHYTCGRVVEIFRKQKFYGFQVRRPYRLFKSIVVSMLTVFKKRARHFLFHGIIFKHAFHQADLLKHRKLSHKSRPCCSEYKDKCYLFARQSPHTILIDPNFRG